MSRGPKEGICSECKKYKTNLKIQGSNKGICKNCVDKEYQRKKYHPTKGPREGICSECKEYRTNLTTYGKNKGICIHCVQKEYRRKNNPPAKKRKKIVQTTKGPREGICSECKEYKTNLRTFGKNKGICKNCVDKENYRKKKPPIKRKTISKDFPHLLKDWDWDLNEVSPDQVTHASSITIHWKCHECGYKWSGMPCNRTIFGSNCHCCAGQPRHATATYNFEVLYPELTKEWHPDNEIDAYKILPSYKEKVMWKCHICKHVWEASPNNRRKTKNLGCRDCCRVSEINNLQVKFPEFANEYSSKNPIPPNLITPGSSRLVWWKCSECDHEWQQTIHSRTNQGTGCPSCEHTPNPKLYKEYLFKQRMYQLQQTKERNRDAVLDMFVSLGAAAERILKDHDEEIDME